MLSVQTNNSIITLIIESRVASKSIRDSTDSGFDRFGFKTK
jgi:hypothetical protein